MQRIVEQMGCVAILDKSRQMISIETEEESAQHSVDGKQDNVLFARLSEAQSDDFVSGSVLLMKAKQFDDGLYAAIELLVQ